MIKCCECDKELPDETNIEAYIEDKRICISCIQRLYDMEIFIRRDRESYEK